MCLKAPLSIPLTTWQAMKRFENVVCSSFGSYHSMCTDCEQIKRTFRGTAGEEFKVPGKPYLSQKGLLSSLIKLIQFTVSLKIRSSASAEANLLLLVRMSERYSSLSCMR